MATSSFLPKKEEKSGKRNVKKVPFVELFNGRLQGVVSSGSDIKRVYVSFIEAGTFNFYCSTNNNRICGGISSSYHCKHLSNLIDEAIKQFGIDTVADFMKIDGDVKDSSELTGKMSGNIVKEHSGEIFTRFLEYLKFLEAPSSNQHIPEMSWFV